MGEAAEHGEVVAEGAQRRKVRRGFVATPCLGGEELGREHAEIIRDQQHSLGRRESFLATEDRCEATQNR